MKLPTLFTQAQFSGLPLPEGRLSAQVFETNAIELRYYSPRGNDAQVPHDRDELYFVIAGTGRFVRNGESVQFGPSDVLFAAAHEAHCFEAFTEEFATWVVFYGDRNSG